jgi:hypothetical protein
MPRYIDMSKQVKGSGLLTGEGPTEFAHELDNKTILLIKHITSIRKSKSDMALTINTVDGKEHGFALYKKADEKAVIDFISSEQNLVKPKSVTGTILAAAGLV